MLKAVLVGTAGIAVMVGGMSVVGHWQRDRIDECEQRAARLASLVPLSKSPNGLQPSGEAYAGCDVDRGVAYAGRQYVGAVEQDRATEFYRLVLEQAGWQVDDRVPPPGHNTAILCARTGFDGIKTFLNLSVATTRTYELHIADARDSGSRCSALPAWVD